MKANFINRGQLPTVVRLLFVCIGNTCRSQMAEGWARHLGLNAASAGTTPGTAVATNAVQVMAEKGIDISNHTPKSLDSIDHASYDLIFSMGCGVSCPAVPLNGDWELEDPYGQPVDVYRQTRDEIERRIRELADLHSAQPRK